MRSGAECVNGMPNKPQPAFAENNVPVVFAANDHRDVVEERPIMPISKNPRWFSEQNVSDSARYLVSVVVPVYNVSNYIKECIDSIINQTYSNLQIILVDDGSTDGSGHICDFYASMDRRVTVLHQPNYGLSVARNVGIAAAQGEFLAFVDGDDVLSPLFIETLLTCICSYQVDIAAVGFCKSSKDLMRTKDKKFENIKLLSGIEASRALQSDESGFYTVVWNKLYKRSLWTDVQFPKDRCHEDEYISYRLLWMSNSISVSSAPLYFYRQHLDSVMGKGLNICNFDAIEALVQREGFYSEQGETYCAAYTQATICYRLREMSPLFSLASEEGSRRWKDVMWKSFKCALKSPLVPIYKKASLILQMLSPKMHKHVMSLKYLGFKIKYAVRKV